MAASKTDKKSNRVGRELDHSMVWITPEFSPLTYDAITMEIRRVVPALKPSTEGVETETHQNK